MYVIFKFSASYRSNKQNNMKNICKISGFLFLYSAFIVSCTQQSTKDYTSSTKPIQIEVPETEQRTTHFDKSILSEEQAESEYPFDNNIYTLSQPNNKISNVDTETYAHIQENKFKDSKNEPLSTFSLDVDRASYSNVRRMLLNGNEPNPDAVRLEEMINYFNYDYEIPSGVHPIRVNHELTECPWNNKHQILHLGIKAKELEKNKMPPSNIVFLMDVSGSMNEANKLPLVKSSFKLLLNQLRPTDRVAIVTYAGNAGIALESTEISEKKKILNALEMLHAGGSTAGAQGILTAYKIAEENFIKNGNNRIILATDGDFNVGVNSPEELIQLIERKRKSDIFLSVLGFGTGNYKDHQMQALANSGNGNHSYIDNLKEAQKILVREFGGTLFTIAKDVKIQIEFNPAYVGAYRLIGYENRLLNNEDFNDDTKDAGEIGLGHSMTAIYEIVPNGINSHLVSSIDPLKYQDEQPVSFEKNNELATIKFRYKKPTENSSIKFEEIVRPNVTQLNQTKNHVRFALAVANFGMYLRSSDYLQDSHYEKVVQLAMDAKGKDANGERAECIQLMGLYKELSQIAD